MAHYRGVDVSLRMVRLAQTRLASHVAQADVILSEGGPPIDEPGESYDRFVSNYVFDLLSHEDIRLVLREAHRMLRPGGLLCLSGLTSGVGIASRIMAGVFRSVHSVRAFHSIRAVRLFRTLRPLHSFHFSAHRSGGAPFLLI